MDRKIVFLFLIFVLSFSVLSFGIYPARIILDNNFTEKNVSFYIVNTDSSNITVFPSTDVDFISFDKDSYFLSADTEKVRVKASISNPNFTSFGLNKIQVLFIQESSSSDFVSASVALASNILVKVPYPGKLLDFNFVYEDDSVIVQLFNLGTEGLDVKGVVSVVVNDTIIVKTFEDETFLESGEDGKFSFPYNLKTGNTSFFVSLGYDDKILEDRFDFYVAPAPKVKKEFPVLLGVIILLVILIVVNIIVFARKRTKKL